MGSTTNRGEKMGFNATWSMAVGGMVGGGIFSVLGVVVSVAGQWAWASFVIAGMIALATAYSYSQLANRFGESGGAFTFLREIHHEGFAGSLSWVLIFGYVLTISVYAFTFGHYISHVFSLGAWFPRASALAIIAVLTWLNLRGVGDASAVEIITVWGKLAVLVGLAAIGVWRWSPEQLSAGGQEKTMVSALVGAATVFMAYEGFQLLTYDYDEIQDARRILPRASLSAVVVVMLVYVAVAIGATMLVGAETVIEQAEVALAVAGRKALGMTGLILVTVAALFSTASAINATLFATARFMKDVARDGELPRFLARTNDRNVPARAVEAIALAGATLAVLGSLEQLVEAASLVFLFTFGTVNVLAFTQSVPRRGFSLLGAVGAGAATIVLFGRLATRAPGALISLVAVIILATVGRPLIKKWTKTR